VLTQDAYHAEVEAPATLWQDWSGNINFGYAIQSGDEKTSTLTASVIATRERPHDLVFMRHWRTNYGLNMLFAKAREDGELVKSDAITTNLRQDYLFTSRDFVFGTAQLDHINAQGLYLRQTYGGGLGRDFIHTNRTLFSATGGVAYIREKFVAGPFNQSAEGAIGEKLSIQINSRVHFDHALGFFPDLEHRSRYHADASANLALKISGRFVANAGAIDQYIAKPAPGTRNNNVALTTGLGYTF
jgi:putative salt-induced outer membrane protein YdiY